MNATQYKIALLIAIFSQFTAYALVALGIKDVWYILNAVTHISLWFTLLISIRKANTYKCDKWCNNLTLYGVILAANQLLDEEYGDPTKFQYNEVVALLIIFFHYLYGRKRK